jgi:hypothetical protein
MTFHRITTLTSFLTLFALTTACDKQGDGSENADQGDTSDDGSEAAGSDDGDNQGGEFGGNCGDEVVSLVDDLDAELPGFDGSVTDYLGLIEGSYLGDFNWHSQEGFLTIAHAGTTSPLTISVDYEGGEVRLAEVELVGQPPEGGFEFGTCSNVLSIDVTLGFATEDGVFAEAFAVPVRVYSHSFSDSALASFYFSVDLAALQGSLALADFSIDNGEVSDLVMTGDLDGDTINGSLNIEIMTMDWVGFGGIADFQATRTL